MNRIKSLYILSLLFSASAPLFWYWAGILDRLYKKGNKKMIFLWFRVNWEEKFKVWKICWMWMSFLSPFAWLDKATQLNSWQVTLCFHGILKIWLPIWLFWFNHWPRRRAVFSFSFGCCGAAFLQGKPSNSIKSIMATNIIIIVQLFAVWCFLCYWSLRSMVTASNFRWKIEMWNEVFYIWKSFNVAKWLYRDDRTWQMKR